MKLDSSRITINVDIENNFIRMKNVIQNFLNNLYQSIENIPR